MSITDKIEAVLQPLFANYYRGMQDFSAGEPAEYAIYTCTSHVKTAYASGKATAEKCMITVDVFTPCFCEDAYYDRIISAFETAGFAYSGGSDITAALGYPARVRYTLDFVYDSCL